MTSPSVPPARPPGRLRRWGFRLLALFAGALALLTIFGAWRLRDRNPGYVVDLVRGPAAPGASTTFRVGFARHPINPDLSRPERPVWIAGFSNGRAATGLHDDLEAVACVWDDGATRIGIVALDAIGLFHDAVIDVRRRLPAEWKLDYTVIASTHNHSTPDLMGIWGKDFLHTGVDPAYLDQVKQACVTALGEAVAALTPAYLVLHELPTPPDGLMNDTRPPRVYDPDLRALLFRDATHHTVIGSLVNWANHPETPWSRNTELTADFCGVLRDALARGVTVDDAPVQAGLGGIHLYVNGALGGLLTPNPSLAIRDPYLERDFQTPDHDKSRALGRALAHRLFAAFARGGRTNTQPALRVVAQTFLLPVDNPLFLAAPVLGLIDRGHARLGHVRSEMALITLGDASLLSVPGELYPEIANGGIEAPAGADFAGPPVEVPPWRDQMPGQVKFLLGLANDEIGYIIPKSEWDRKPPHLYGEPRPPYGEVNSLGPETAPRLHAVVGRLVAAWRAGAAPEAASATAR